MFTATALSIAGTCWTGMMISLALDEFQRFHQRGAALALSKFFNFDPHT